MPAWAAGFSAFGCACGDYAYRYDQTVDMPIEPAAGDEQKIGVGLYVTGGWQVLRERVVAEFAKSGIGEEQIEFRHYLRMQYLGQLNDLEIYSPHQELRDASQVDDLIAAFEEAYGKLYARSARSPELGYLVTNVIVTGAVAVEKPAVPSERWQLRAHRRRSRTTGRSGGAIGGWTPRSTSRTTSEQGTWSKGRPSSSRRRTRSRSRPNGGHAWTSTGSGTWRTREQLIG